MYQAQFECFSKNVPVGGYYKQWYQHCTNAEHLQRLKKGELVKKHYHRPRKKIEAVKVKQVR